MIEPIQKLQQIPSEFLNTVEACKQLDDLVTRVVQTLTNQSLLENIGPGDLITPDEKQRITTVFKFNRLEIESVLTLRSQVAKTQRKALSKSANLAQLILSHSLPIKRMKLVN